MRTRSIGMDLLRVFAALWVVSFHWTHIPGISSTVPAWVSALTHEGSLGVEIFFVLSGAVIVHTAIGRTWRSFAIARFLRLFPVYIATTVVVLVGLAFSANPGVPIDYLSLSGMQFWTGDDSIVPPAWTLGFEVTFYVLVALLLVRTELTAERVRLAAFGFLLVSLLALATQEPVLGFLTLQPFGPLFALGALLGISTNRELLRANAPAILVAAALSYAMLLNRTKQVEGWVQVVLVLVLLLVCCAVILIGSRETTNARPDRRIYRAIATLSLMTYPIYLIHLNLGNPLILRLDALGLPAWAALAIALAGVLLASWLSVKFYEPAARRWLSALFGWTRPARPVQLLPEEPAAAA